MARCESSPKGVDRAIFSEMHWRSAEARSEGGREGRSNRERERDGKERGEQLVNVADHLYISQGIQSLLSCCCASRLGFVKQFLILSYYWNRGAMLHAGFAGIKSILWIHLGT